MNCAVCYMSFANAATAPRLSPCGEGECGGDAATCICQDCVHGWIDATHLFESMRCPCCRLPYHLQHLLKVCDRPHADKLLAAHAARAASSVRKNETRALLQRIPELRDAAVGSSERRRQAEIRAAFRHMPGVELKQCAFCGYGPMINLNCSNLGTHAHEHKNACPKCGTFEADFGNLPMWDPIGKKRDTEALPTLEGDAEQWAVGTTPLTVGSVVAMPSGFGVVVEPMDSTGKLCCRRGKRKALIRVTRATIIPVTPVKFARLTYRHGTAFHTVSGKGCTVSRCNTKGQEHHAMCRVDGTWFPLHSVAVAEDDAVSSSRVEELHGHILGHTGRWHSNQQQDAWCDDEACVHGHTVEHPHWTCCGNTSKHDTCTATPDKMYKKKIDVPMAQLPLQADFLDEIRDAHKGGRVFAPRALHPYAIDTASRTMAYNMPGLGVVAESVEKRQLFVDVHADRYNTSLRIKLPYTFAEFCERARVATGVGVASAHVVLRRGSGDTGRCMDSEQSYTEFLRQAAYRRVGDPLQMVVVHTGTRPEPCVVCDNAVHWPKASCRAKLAVRVAKMPPEDRMVAEAAVQSLRDMAAACHTACQHCNPHTTRACVDRATDTVNALVDLDDALNVYQSAFVHGKTHRTRVRVWRLLQRLKAMAGKRDRGDDKGQQQHDTGNEIILGVKRIKKK